MWGEAIHLERINALAYRNFRYISGQKQFKFNNKINQLLGTGRTTILDILTLVFEPKELIDSNQDSQTRTVIEMDFTADDKNHVLYWAFQGSENLQVRISIGDGAKYETITDQEALEYLNRVVKPHRIGEGPYSKLYFPSTKEFEMISHKKMERMLILANSWLKQGFIEYLFLKDGKINVVLHAQGTFILKECNEPERVKVSDLLALASLVDEMDSGDITRVVLLDDIFPVPYIELQNIINLLYQKHQIQFITTIRFNGPSKVVNIDVPMIPNQYRQNGEKIQNVPDKFRWENCW